MQLFEAHKQWAERPADERFWSLADMHQQCRQYAGQARQATVRMDKLDVVPHFDDLELVGNELRAKLTHWSFGQIAARVAAPASYVRMLPAPIAAECLSHGLKQIGRDGAEAKALFHQNGSLVCRAFTSDDYARIWNHEVLERLLKLEQGGWRVPPARPARQGQPGTRTATAEDVLRLGGESGLSINVGDLLAPAGLYASDHDCFAFMVNEERRIEDGSPGGLGRGFFVSNSEVGAGALKVTRFLYRYVCGNHIVWDAKDVQELRIIHRGHNDRRYGYRLQAELRQYADASTAEDEGRIAAAKKCLLGASKEEVIDRLFGLKVLPKKSLEKAYEHAEHEAALRLDVSPRSAWGFAQGMTSMSQDSEFADDRVAIDRAAGKVLTIAF